METKNFKKDDNQELENSITNPETLESITETPESTNDSFDTNNLEEQVVSLEGEITDHVDKTNEVRAELGLTPEHANNIPALKNKLSVLDKVKNYLKNTAKAATMAGIMLAGTSDATAQTNKTLDTNPEVKKSVDMGGVMHVGASSNIYQGGVSLVKDSNKNYVDTFIDDLEKSGIKVTDKTKIGTIRDGKVVSASAENARAYENERINHLEPEPKNPKDLSPEIIELRNSLLKRFKEKGVVDKKMDSEEFLKLSKAEVDILFKKYGEKVGALDSLALEKRLKSLMDSGAKLVKEQTTKFDLLDIDKTPGSIDVASARENAFNDWFAEQYKEVKKGNLKDGAIVEYNNTKDSEDPRNGKSFKIVLNPDKSNFVRKNKTQESSDKDIVKGSVEKKIVTVEDYFKNKGN